MNIVKYIIEILKKNEKVAVPGLGTFSLEYKATTIHPVEHSFTPASKTIVFESTMNDDDTLARTISEQEQISIDAAVVFIKSFTDALNSDIQKGKLTGIEGLGVFSLTADQLISFVPESTDFSDDEFGLTGFTSPAIVRSEFKDKAAYNAQKAKDKQLKRSRRNRRLLAAFVAVVMITALIFLVFFTDIIRNYLYNNDTNSQTEQNAVVNETPTPEIVTADTNSLKDDSLATDVNSTLPDESKAADASVTANEIAQGIQYYLVAASFKSEENANKSITALKAKGYANAGIIRQYEDKGMFIVYYESHSNKEEASNALKQIIKTENRDSWMLKK